MDCQTELQAKVPALTIQMIVDISIKKDYHLLINYLSHFVQCPMKKEVIRVDTWSCSCSSACVSIQVVRNTLRIYFIVASWTFTHRISQI